jgi:hypothetical protein
VEVEDAAEHHGLAGVQVAADGGLRDQHLQVLGGRLLLEAARADAEQPQHEIGDGCQRAGQRPRRHQEEVEGARDAP